MKRTMLSVVLLCLSISTAGAATVTSVSGSPRVLKPSTKQWQPAGKGAELGSNDRVRCDAGSRAEIRTKNGHRIKLWPNSEVSLAKIDAGETNIQLLAGRLRSWVRKLKANDKYEVKTPVAVCSVRGTDFSVEVGEDRQVRVEVYEGRVAAREEATGSEVTVNAGEFSAIEHNRAPQPPQRLPESKEGRGEELTTERAAREEARREIFQEISREAVLARAADEIKLAEYQNGKAAVDVSGNRVRMEEYIVRSQPNEFKYVVLNTRAGIPLDPANPGNGHFNFGKIVFTFNDTLPSDLTLATRTMFESEGAVQPQWWLTDVLSVMSNTLDQVNEDASGGRMFPDNASDPGSWRLAFDRFEFQVNNKTWWLYNDVNRNGRLDAGEFTYYNIATGNPLNFTADFQTETDADTGVTRYFLMDGSAKLYFNELSQPDGEDAFHFHQRNNYTADQWIAADDYVVSDEGDVFTLANLRNKTQDDLHRKAYESNFERVYTSSVFEGRKIDLVFSAKLLIDSGMLKLPDPRSLD